MLLLESTVFMAKRLSDEYDIESQGFHDAGTVPPIIETQAYVGISSHFIVKRLEGVSPTTYKKRFLQSALATSINIQQKSQRNELQNDYCKQVFTTVFR